MKVNILMCTLITAISLSAHAGTSAQEKAFIDKYKTAFEAKDTAVLESFLYAQGADPPKTSSPRKTANSLSPFQGRVNKGPSVRGAILVKHRTRFGMRSEVAR